ncbi:hypothetical protein K227x_19390 [Rubripirellula lacrimiformis]|uniref:Uncharacterized protein n=1 Tax=Rubripirellula lacrimiformis TaxID=1930273 RepID=A0A517N8T4_9BACT|nr:hypothetical protein [Rubripirellula lacrimiformis]QDT03555.1 hypothetical protein K227x_19390 [Rubripirellula lacrimiformis]
MVACLLATVISVATPNALIRSAIAQPPGTLPPNETFSDQDDGQLPIQAFMFLSEAGSKVMMPRVTWEEYERRMNLESSTDGRQQSFSYQSLSITGATEGGRAEMEVVLKLSIDSTGGRWVKIPLRMENFHSLAPPDVSGIDEYSMTFDPASSDYVLSVKTAAVSDAMVRLRMSSQVQSHSMRSMDFRLPDVPSQVRLTIDAADVDGEVVGRGDETLTASPRPGAFTELAIESGGGNFSVRWGRLSRSTQDLPLLEVESRIEARWDSPQDQPHVSVRLTVRNAKGSIDGFQLRLPPGSVVLDTPRLGLRGQTIELGYPDPPADRGDEVADGGSINANRGSPKPKPGPAARAAGIRSAEDSLAQLGEIRTITIPDEERQQRIDLNFDLQLAADNTSASSPLDFRVVEVVGSLRHQGEVSIRTGGDYRLRWRTRPWVRSEPSETPDEGLSGRLYRFRFDRASFALPVWLSAKERQVRLTSASELTIRDSVASLVMDVQATGQASDGRLQLEESDWKISSIENIETGEPLESFRSDSLRVIDFNPAAIDDTTAIRIRAQRSFADNQTAIDFAIPRVVATDDNVLIQSSSLNLTSSGRTLLVIDLAASQGLTRVASTRSENVGASSISTFRMLNPDEPSRLVGVLVDQPPRITLSSDATVELDGDQLRSTVDWIVTSPLDLEGRLPIRIPSPAAAAAATNERSTDTAGNVSAPTPTIATGADRFDGSDPDADEPWVVTVDGVPATLRPLDDDRYELISERLASGTMAIRWRHSQNRRSVNNLRATELVSMPRPNIADVTVRGTVRVNLRGNQPFDLTSTDSPPTTMLELDTLPRDPLRLRLNSRVAATEEITIRQALIRTVVGRSTRQEQVIARIQGGDYFQVGLPPGTPDVSVEALIDNERVPVQRQENALIVPLAGDRSSHVVDLRVWISMPTNPSYAVITPLLKLPAGVGRVFWRIIAPNDGHVVWASPTVGRSMAWRFDGWKLYRESSHTDAALNAMIGGDISAGDPPASENRYLYVGSDLPSFEVVVVSRTVLWICVGSFVLLLAILLTHIPRSRHPMTAIVVAVLFAGLLAIAPDAAVLAGQLGMIALVLVIAMISIRVLVTPSGGGRVFSSTSVDGRTTPSTRSIQASKPESVSLATTQAMAPTPEGSQ